MKLNRYLEALYFQWITGHHVIAEKHFYIDKPWFNSYRLCIFTNRNFSLRIDLTPNDQIK
jgi:hypothetical protein